MFEFKVEKQLVAHIIKNEKNNNNKYFKFDIIAEEMTLNTKLGEKRFDLIGMDNACFYFIEVKPKITDDKKFNGEFKRVVRLMKSFKTFKETKYLFVASKIDINAKKKIDRYNQIDYVEIKDAIHNKKLPTPPPGKENSLEDVRFNMELSSAIDLSRFTTKYYKNLNGNEAIGEHCNIIKLRFQNNLGINIKYERTHYNKIKRIYYQVIYYNKSSVDENYHGTFSEYEYITNKIRLFEIANYIKSIPVDRIIYTEIYSNEMQDALKQIQETSIIKISRKYNEDIFKIYNYKI